MKTIHALLSVSFVALLGAGATAQFDSGALFVPDYGQNMVHRVDPVTGSSTIFATSGDGLSSPSGVGFNSAGNLLVANYGTSTVIEFDETGNGTIVLDASDGLAGPFGENCFAIDSANRLYVANYNLSQILRFDADYTGGIVFADKSDGLVFPDGLAFRADGDMLVANRGGGGQVLLIDPLGNTSVWDTITGEDCFSLVVRDNGDVYVACSSGRVYRYQDGDPNQRTLLGTWGTSNTGISFAPDFSVLYHAASSDGKIHRIDPDSGASTLVVDTPWAPVGLVVAGGQFPPGSISHFGQGTAGTGGNIPGLIGSGDARLGAPVTLESRNFVGGAPSFLIVGDRRGDRLLAGGTLYPDLFGTFWIFPAFLGGTPGVAGAGTLDRNFVLPNDPLAIGTNWYVQEVAIDAAAVNGLVLTNGVRVFIGE